MFKIKKCDNCGKINPKLYENNPRLCGECVTENGFYKLNNSNLGANGKINLYKIQFPFRIYWRGWWTL